MTVQTVTLTPTQRAKVSEKYVQTAGTASSSWANFRCHQHKQWKLMNAACTAFPPHSAFIATNTNSESLWILRAQHFHLIQLSLPPTQTVKAYECCMHSISTSFSFHCHQHKQWKLMNAACTAFPPHSAFIATNTNSESLWILNAQHFHLIQLSLPATYTKSEGIWILNAQHFLLDQPSLPLTQTVKAYEYCMHSTSASSSLHYHQHCVHNLSLGSTPWMLVPLFGMAGQWCPSLCMCYHGNFDVSVRARAGGTVDVPAPHSGVVSLDPLWSAFGNGHCFLGKMWCEYLIPSFALALKSQ